MKLRWLTMGMVGVYTADPETPQTPTAERKTVGSYNLSFERYGSAAKP